MKMYLAVGIISAWFLASCGENTANESTTTTTDSSTSQQSNSAAAPTDSNSAGTTATAPTTGSFKNVMDKTMQAMHSMQMSGDPDHDFAMMMKTHHQGAIDMANIELSKGTNAELKQVAQKTIDDSQKDISDLNTFMSNHQPSKKTDFAKNQMDKMMKMDMNMTESGDTDKDFAMMMAMHHQHGIDMAREYLKVGTAEETKKVANNTIKSNSEDLKKLKAHAGHDMSQMDAKGSDIKKSESSDKPATEHSQH